MTCKLILLGLFVHALLAGILRANTVSLMDVYSGLAKTWPLEVRQRIALEQANARSRQVLAPYAMAVQVQSDIGHRAYGGSAGAGAVATVPLIQDQESGYLRQSEGALRDADLMAIWVQQLLRYQEITQLYFSGLVAQLSARHTAEIRRVLMEQRRWVAQQVKIGRYKPTVLNSIDVSLAKIAMTENTYRTQAKQSLLHLSAQTGIDPNSTFVYTHRALPRQAPLQHPKLELLRHTVDSLRAREEALQWQLWPRIDMVAQGQTRDGVQTHFFGVQGTWTVIDGDLRHARRMGLAAQQEDVQVTLQSQYRQILGASWAQEERVQAAAKEWEMAKSAEVAAKAQYEAYREELQLHLVSVLEVLQTVHMWHETLLDRARREIAYYEAGVVGALISGTIPEVEEMAKP